MRCSHCYPFSVPESLYRHLYRVPLAFDSRRRRRKKAPPKEPPALQGQSEITGTMYGNIVNYQSDWEDKEDWKYNFAQKHDVELAKKKIRVDVEAELKEAVDVAMLG